ncbi:MAG TPA: hypothetical protein VJB35_05925 [Candidatus Nanoarchaeia archaeon]|nr:hypothetical protein [Candidatus Nanoarchaeia archaeon]
MKGYFVKEDTIIINRDLNDLDLFVKDFLEILKKYCDYLIVSGFVSISTGRTRGTEDVDLLIKFPKKDVFEKLFLDLEKNNFWCYQGETIDAVYPYVKEMQSIRFARIGELFPNMEVIFIDLTKKAKSYEFNHPQKIKISDFEFKIPPIEFEILYKEIILASKKDFEDARHLRVFFSEILNKEKFEECKKVIMEDKKW